MYWIVQQAVKPPVNSPGVRAATAKKKGPKQIPVDRPFLKGPLLGALPFVLGQVAEVKTWENPCDQK